MEKTLGEIARLIGGETVGDKEIVIKGLSGIKEAEESDLTFVANPKYLPLMEETKASGIIVSRDIEFSGKPLIRVENPDMAFARTVSLFAPETVHPKGIHPDARIGKNVKLGKDVALSAYVVIEDNVEIGDKTIIYAGVYIGHDTRIGADTLIYPHVTIKERVNIGNRVIIHSGTVIASDGFGFSTVRGVHHKIPQIGTVVIEDDVEIGANVTIDRARFDKTLIKKGTKIDNLVQIAHNVTIGEHSIIVAQTGISGSVEIGKGVILAGQSGVIGHVRVGDNVIAAARTGITKSIPDNALISGFPAKVHKKEMKIKASLGRLPELLEEIKTLRKRIEKLEK